MLDIIPYRNALNDLILAVDGVPETLDYLAKITPCICDCEAPLAPLVPCHRCEYIRLSEKVKMAYNPACELLNEDGLDA